MKTILVTGGAGYVGSHACKYLSRAGFLPVTFDDLSTGHEWAVKWGPLERGRLQQAATIRKAIENPPIAIVSTTGLKIEFGLGPAGMAPRLARISHQTERGWSKVPSREGLPRTGALGILRAQRRTG